MSGRIGHPKYTYGDVVLFRSGEVVGWDGELLYKDKELEGIVEIVDAYGTFEQDQQPSYDIYVKEPAVLYKHIPEDSVIKKIRTATQEERLQ